MCSDKMIDSWARGEQAVTLIDVHTKSWAILRPLELITIVTVASYSEMSNGDVTFILARHSHVCF